MKDQNVSLCEYITENDTLYDVPISSVPSSQVQMRIINCTFFSSLKF